MARAVHPGFGRGFPLSVAYRATALLPWLLALKAIPWDTILENAPSILRSADALVSKTRVRPDAASPNDVQALADRISLLEQRDSDTAELLARVTAQVARLTTAGEVLEARARWLLVVAIAASVMSVAAIGAPCGPIVEVVAAPCCRLVGYVQLDTILTTTFGHIRRTHTLGNRATALLPRCATDVRPDRDRSTGHHGQCRPIPERLITCQLSPARSSA